MIDFSEDGLRVANAKVKFAFLGPEEGNPNGELMYQIGFDTEIGTVATGKTYLESASTISDILNVMEVRSWEELPRKFARIKISDKTVVAIGNLIQNKWLYIAPIRKAEDYRI